MSESDPGFLSRWARRKAQSRQGISADATAADQAAPAGPTAAPPKPVGALPATAATLPAAAGDREPASGDQVRPSPAGTAAPPEPPPPPTLDDVALLDRDAADYSRFVARDVQPEVRNAALKKLFTDPHFNVMDGLDTYIDDYSQPDPLPPGMLERMVQGQFLGLFTEAPEAADDATNASTGLAPGALPPGAHAGPDARVPVASDVEAGHRAGTPTVTPSCSTTGTPAGTLNPTDENADLRLQPHDAAGRSGPAPGAEPPAGRPG